jgi:hypothetical protein
MKARVSDVCTHSVVTYFLALCVTSVAHWNTHPKIWSTTVYAAPWFSNTATEEKSSDLDSVPELKGTRDSWGRLWQVPELDVETGSTKGDTQKPNTRAPWSKNLTIRRGIDNPFRRKEPSSLPMLIIPPSTTLAPPPIARTTAVSKSPDTPSRFVEVFRKSDLPPIPISKDSVSDYGLSVYYEETPAEKNKTFPSGVVDHDQPIPLPRLSEWIRADDALGASVIHKMPSFPPIP